VAEHGFHFSAEVDVHEGVDDRVGDVIEEVRVEDETDVRHDFERHEEGGGKGQQEHDSDDEEHGGGANVRGRLTLALGRAAVPPAIRRRRRHSHFLDATLNRHFVCTCTHPHA